MSKMKAFFSFFFFSSEDALACPSALQYQCFHCSYWQDRKLQSSALIKRSQLWPNLISCIFSLKEEFWSVGWCRTSWVVQILGIVSMSFGRGNLGLVFYWHSNEETISWVFFFFNFSSSRSIKKANQVLVVPSNVLMHAFPPTEQL